MIGSKRRLCSCALALALGAVTTTARANDPVAAQTLFNDARKLMGEGKYAEACVKLEESQKLDPGIGTLFNLAECHVASGRPATAWAEFLEVAATAKAQQQRDREKVARDRAQSLEATLPRLTISVEGEQPGIDVKRDRISVGPGQWGSSIFVDPGDHVVVATAPHKKPWETHVVAQGSSPVKVSVPLLEAEPASPDAAKPDAAPSPVTDGPPASDAARSGGVLTMRNVGIGVAVLGVIGVGAGTLFGLQAKSKLDDSSSHCDATNRCDHVGVSLRDDSLHAGTMSTVAFAVGGAALVGGAVLFFLSPSSNNSTTALRASPLVAKGAGGVALGGSW